MVAAMQTLTPEHALAVVAELIERYELTTEQALLVLVVLAWLTGCPEW